MEQIVHTLEGAAQELLAPPNLVTKERRQAAEKVFLDLQESKDLITLCQFTLEHTKNAFVLFEAASGIKKAILRDWSVMEGQDIENLRSYLLTYVTRNYGIESFIREQILQGAAIILKRGWLDEEKSASMKSVFFEQLFQLLGMDVNMQLIACSLMLRVVEEFSTSSKSSDIGFTWEFHHKCKLSFEQSALKRIYELCLEVLKRFNGAGSLSALGPSELELLSNMSKLADKIVSWDFAVGKSKRSVGSFEPDQDVLLRPGANWREDFLNEERISLFFDLHRKIRNNSTAAHHTLQCLAQLASLTGSVFENEQQEALYLSYVAKGITSLIRDILALGGRQGEVADMGAELYGLCSVINRLVLSFKGEIFMHLGEDFSVLVEQIMGLTSFCLHRTTTDFEDTFDIEAFDQLLGAWDQFMSFDCFGMGFFRQPAGHIFQVYVETRLKRASLEIENYNDEEELGDDDTNFDDQLCGVALLGRYAAKESAAYMCKMLNERINALESALSGQSVNQDLSGLFEDLHWLLLIAGHFLADVGEGEKPLIPGPILSLSIESSAGNFEDYVLGIASLVFRLVEIENKALLASQSGKLSPLLAEDIVWFVGRWLKTYLLPDENDYKQLSQNIVNNFGRDSDGGKLLVGCIMTKICVNLTFWTGEVDVEEESVKTLLAMAKLPSIRSIIIQDENLWTLANSFADPKSSLSKLPGTVQNHLMHAMCCICSGREDPAFIQRLQGILQMIELRFSSLLNKPNFIAISQQPGTITEITNIMELLRGCCCASDSRNTRLMFPLFSKYFEHIVKLLRVYKNCSETSVYVLEFFKDFVKYQLGYLTDAERSVVYETSLLLMKTYAECNTGKYKKPDSNSEEEQYYDLLLFLKILTYLISQDNLDFSSPEVRTLPNESGPQVADVVIYGINIVIPFMNKEMLCFPKLGAQYFKLINILCELYPQTVSSTSESLIRSIMGSLTIGLQSFVSDVTRLVFESIASLAAFNYNLEMKTLSADLNSPMSITLQSFLRSIFEMFLFQNFDMDLLEAASDAFFALICFRHQTYSSLVKELLATQAGSKYFDRSEAAFASLLTANGGVQAIYDRQNKSRFRKNLSFFLMDVRAYFRKK
eukprot:Nk52_evm50s215 gene=Nk52_evmTU50s215